MALKGKIGRNWAKTLTISHWHIGAVQVDSSFWYILEDSKNMFVGFWCLLTTSLAEFLSYRVWRKVFQHVSKKTQLHNSNVISHVMSCTLMSQTYCFASPGHRTRIETKTTPIVDRKLHTISKLKSDRTIVVSHISWHKPSCDKVLQFFSRDTCDTCNIL